MKFKDVLYLLERHRQIETDIDFLNKLLWQKEDRGYPIRNPLFTTKSKEELIDEIQSYKEELEQLLETEV